MILKIVRYLSRNNNKMKKIFLIWICIFGSIFISHGQENDTHTIIVTISGMKSDKGDVYIALYNSEKDFLNKEFKGAIVQVTNLKATAFFKNIKKGTYAISVFHDANDNQKLDTKIFGIPNEPIGTSNNATGFMGPPKFKKAKFIVADNITIPIIVE